MRDVEQDAPQRVFARQYREWSNRLKSARAGELPLAPPPHPQLPGTGEWPQRRRRPAASCGGVLRGDSADREHGNSLARQTSRRRANPCGAPKAASTELQRRGRRKHSRRLRRRLVRLHRGMARNANEKILDRRRHGPARHFRYWQRVLSEVHAGRAAGPGHIEAIVDQNARAGASGGFDCVARRIQELRRVAIFFAYLDPVESASAASRIRPSNAPSGLRPGRLSSAERSVT